MRNTNQGTQGTRKISYRCRMGTKLLTTPWEGDLGMTVANSLKTVALDSERVKKVSKKGKES